MRRFAIFAAALGVAVGLSLSPCVTNSRPIVGHDVAMAASVSADLPMFSTESDAQRHCPRDTVVWLNTNTGIYHLRGERWYGRTKHGAFVCKKEADAAGDRETENGQ